MPSFSKSFLKRAQTLNGDKWKEYLINPMLYFFLSGSEEKDQTGDGKTGHPFAASEFRLSESLWKVGASSACKITDPKPDYLTVFGNQAIPITNMEGWLIEPRSLVLNVETTTQQSSRAKYIAKKICIFAKIVDAHMARADGTSAKETIELLRSQTKGSGKDIPYDKFQSIDDGDKVDFRLIVATDWDKKILDWNAINTHIDDNAGVKRVVLCAGGDIHRGAWKVETDNGCEFLVGQLDMSDVFDLAAVYDAAHGGATPRIIVKEADERELRYEFTDRMLWSITESAFGLNHAHMAHHDLHQYSLPGQGKTGFQHQMLSGGAGSISAISELDKQKFDTGLECDMFQIRVPLGVLARMGRVERTIASRENKESLQRNPNGTHCRKMAQDLGRGKRFHLPVFAFLPKGTDINISNQTIVHSGPDLVPYQWLIVDGQHRMLSRYFLRKGDLNPAEFQRLKNQFTVDIIAYVPPDSASDAKIRQAQTEIFYQLNYLGLDPNPNLKILHESHMSKRPSNWTWEDDMKTKPRMMVMKWFTHLNKALNDKNGTVFLDPVFDVQLTGQGMKLSSIMTYLQKYFDFGVKFESDGAGGWRPKSRKNKSLHPVVGFKKSGDAVIWGVAGCTPYLAKNGRQGPHPSECDAELKKIADSFVTWLEELDVNIKPGGTAAADWVEGIFSWINLENAKSHYLAALFRIFVHDYGKEHTLHDSESEVSNWISTKIVTTPFGLTSNLRSKIGAAICRDPNWQTTTGGQGQIKEIVNHILDGYNADAAVIAAGSSLTID